MSETATTDAAARWNLFGQIEESGSVRCIPIASSPFVVGRRSDLSLSLPCRSASKVHAELRLIDHSLHVRDLSSTNGTFVNGLKIAEEAAVQAGDLLQFGNVIFQVIGPDSSLGPDAHTIPTDASDSARAMVQFDRLMTTRAVVPYFQPIVTFSTHETIACEVLGRSRLFGVRTPRAMFSAATRLHQEAQLSRLLRAAGVQAGASLPGAPNLFLNTHPSELQSAELVDSLRELREELPDLQMTLEIHEAAVTQCTMIRELQEILREFNIQLAYDDFGAGQSRLLELSDVVPDYLKFDMEFIREIQLAPAERLKVVATLVRMARELGATPLAEGIETEGEAQTCEELGFVLGQGFYFGRPVAARDYAAPAQKSVAPVVN